MMGVLQKSGLEFDLFELVLLTFPQVFTGHLSPNMNL